MPIVRSLRMELKFHCQSLILYYSPHPLRYIVENHWQIGLGELLSRCELFWCSLCSPPSSSLSATCALWITRHPNADDGAFLHHDKLDGAFSARAFQRWRHSSWNALLSFIANASSATFLLRNLYSHSSEQQKPVRRLYSNTIQVLIHCDDGLLLFIYIKKEEPDVSRTSNKPIVIIHVCASKSSIRMKRLRFVSQTRSLRCRQRFTGNAHYFHGLGSSREHIKQIY